MSFIDHSPRSATAIALEDTALELVDKDSYTTQIAKPVNDPAQTGTGIFDSSLSEIKGSVNIDVTQLNVAIPLTS